MNKKEAAEKLGCDILDFVNCYGFDSDTFAETICAGHRTLQQSTMRLFVATMRRMAQNSFDERNAEAVGLAIEFTRIADMRQLPLI